MYVAIGNNTPLTWLGIWYNVLKGTNVSDVKVL